MTTPIPGAPDSSQLSLNDDQVRRIAEEERLRSRLRSEFDLQAKDKTQSRWWKFLNSSFGIFLLSSVLLAGLTGLHTQMQSYYRQLELRNQEILKVTTELKYRLEQLRASNKTSFRELPRFLSRPWEEAFYPS